MKLTWMIPAVLALGTPALANTAKTKGNAHPTTATTNTATTTAENAAPANLDKAKIMQIQKALNKNGFKVNVDGAWNQATMDAIRSFQTKNALTVTGQADQPTMAKLGVNL